ncbi:hypothetical protein Q0590_19860 [Rhodocytophaga aerolata]|uniref:DUF6597 domain-containing protein n=1 Tax=Rhodocytophaga aerolata TaxID=455078 RepID=A0ABT8RBJ1_9BACT|nr:DUF6597 domain-containing transcriptional factor [Rhodocytophaga aerolata]MDO1448543.1 hypothetical protein [Rhodocytophaga aerolata]
MKYYKISPSVALQPYIMCYYVWEQKQPLVSPLEINSPPNGLGGMVFNYGDPPYLLKNDGTSERIPSCFVAGQFTRNYTLRLSGTIGMIGVVFWPVGLSYVLQMPMIEFTDQRVDLQLILKEEAASLENCLLECQTTYTRIQVL